MFSSSNHVPPNDVLGRIAQVAVDLESLPESLSSVNVSTLLRKESLLEGRLGVFPVGDDQVAILPFRQRKRGAFQEPPQPKCRAVDVYSLLKNLKR